MFSPAKLSLRWASLCACLALLNAVHAPAARAAQDWAAQPLIAVASPRPTADAIASAHLVGQLASTAPLSVAITLPLRNQAQLQAQIQAMYDKSSPSFGHYLNPSQFAAAYGPTQADYQTVVDYAQSQGLNIQKYSSRDVLVVSGSSAKISSAFHTSFNNYRLASGRIAYASTSPALLPSSVASVISGVVGLDNLVKARPQYVLTPHTAYNPLAQVGNDSSGGLTPKDIKAIYDLNPVGLQGEGQSMALVELDGYNSGDINAYVTKFNLPVNPSILYNIYTGGFNGVPGASQDEVVLDIDMMLALVPRASRIYVYEAENISSQTNFLELFTQIADDDFAKSISCSFGLPDDELQASYGLTYSSVMSSENNAFEEMAAQGQSFFDAAGDNGAYDDGTNLTVDDPAQQPYVTAVGGTLLSPKNPGTAQIGYGTESAWGSTAEAGGSNPKGAGGGGGYSDYFLKPWYQYSSMNISNPTGPVGFSAVSGEIVSGAPAVVPNVPMRDLPDVSLNADPASGYAIYVGADDPPGIFPNDFFVVGGTSAAAPLWAAFTGLVNEARAASSMSVTPGSNPGVPAVPVGFANPLIYQIGFGEYGSYSSDFHDIADFSNNLAYVAQPGFDDATGWGSYNGAYLLYDMARYAPGAAAGSAGGSSGGSGGTGGTTGTGGSTAVTGTVTFNGSAPPSGVSATINAVSTDGTQSGTAVTDVNGNYSLSLPSGYTYNFTASAAGYLSEVKTGITLSSATSIVAFQLASNSSSQSNTFSAGLQMITEPFDFSATGLDFAGLFGITTPIPAGGPELFLWQSEAGVYAQYPNPPANTLSPGIGYWLIVPSSYSSGLTLHVSGTPVAAPFVLPLQPGWNQIGDPFTTPEPFSNITVAVDSAGTGTVALSSASGLVAPEMFSYPAGSSAYTLDTTVMQPYLGYWIYAYQASYLTFH